MKLALILLACVGLAASSSFYKTQEVRVADKNFLERQKFLFEIVYRIEDPLFFEEWIKFGDKFIVDKSFYTVSIFIMRCNCILIFQLFLMYAAI